MLTTAARLLKSVFCAYQSVKVTLFISLVLFQGRIVGHFGLRNREEDTVVVDIGAEALPIFPIPIVSLGIFPKTDKVRTPHQL